MSVYEVIRQRLIREDKESGVYKESVPCVPVYYGILDKTQVVKYTSAEELKAAGAEYWRCCHEYSDDNAYHDWGIYNEHLNERLVTKHRETWTKSMLEMGLHVDVANAIYNFIYNVDSDVYGPIEDLISVSENEELLREVLNIVLLSQKYSK